jgi:hypothetical protein
MTLNGTTFMPNFVRSTLEFEKLTDARVTVTDVFSIFH